MEWLEIAENLSKKTADSRPPTQWFFLLVLVAVAFIGGMLLDKELAQAALEREFLKRKKRYVEELREKARASADAAEAAKLLTQASDLKLQLLKKEFVWKKNKQVILDKVKRLESARSWKELEDA